MELSCLVEATCQSTKLDEFAIAMGFNSHVLEPMLSSSSYSVVT